MARRTIQEWLEYTDDPRKSFNEDEMLMWLLADLIERSRDTNKELHAISRSVSSIEQKLARLEQFVEFASNRRLPDRVEVSS